MNKPIMMAGFLSLVLLSCGQNTLPSRENSEEIIGLSSSMIYDTSTISAEDKAFIDRNFGEVQNLALSGSIGEPINGVNYPVVAGTSLNKQDLPECVGVAGGHTEVGNGGDIYTFGFPDEDVSTIYWGVRPKVNYSVYLYRVTLDNSALGFQGGVDNARSLGPPSGFVYSPPNRTLRIQVIAYNRTNFAVGILRCRTYFSLNGSIEKFDRTITMRNFPGPAGL